MIRPALLVATLSLILTTGASAAPPGPVYKGDPAVVAEIQAVYKKMGSMHTWRARTTNFRAGAPVGTSTIQFVAPDRYHITVISGGRTSDMFRVGKNSWMLSGNVCRKMPSSIPVPGPGDPQGLGASVTVTVARGDPATIDGIPTVDRYLHSKPIGLLRSRKLFAPYPRDSPRTAAPESTPKRTRGANPSGRIRLGVVGSLSLTSSNRASAVMMYAVAVEPRKAIQVCRRSSHRR